MNRLPCTLNGVSGHLVTALLNHVIQENLPMRYLGFDWAGHDQSPIMVVIPQAFGEDPIMGLRVIFSLS